MSEHPFNTFKQLHQQQQPLVLMNIWDAASAAMVQHLGARALATSSAALAWAHGYPDGDTLPTEVLLTAVAGIMRVAQVPLSVDIEAGYSDSPQQVAALVAKLVALGVCGINIEDGEQAPALLADKIAAITAAVGSQAVFINARTDVYLRSLVAPAEQVASCIQRAACYAEAGAHGCFVPGLSQADEVGVVANGIALPLNVMDSSPQPDLCGWRALQVSRVSMGPGPFLHCYAALLNLTGSDKKSWSFEQVNSLFT